MDKAQLIAFLQAQQTGIGQAITVLQTGDTQNYAANVEDPEIRKLVERRNTEDDRADFNVAGDICRLVATRLTTAFPQEAPTSAPVPSTPTPPTPSDPTAPPPA
jgi:hypothetical protein